MGNPHSVTKNYNELKEMLFKDEDHSVLLATAEAECNFSSALGDDEVESKFAGSYKNNSKTRLKK